MTTARPSFSPTLPADLPGAQASTAGSTPTPAQLAKATLRRLAADRLEPTPENYARAYSAEAGEAAPVAAAQASSDRTTAEAGPSGDGAWLATLIERAVRGIERSGRNWTAARKKESLQRVLSGSRSDAGRLQQRLLQLIASWESDSAESAQAEGLTDTAPLGGEVAAPAASPAVPESVVTATTPPEAAAPAAAAPEQINAWQPIASQIAGTVQAALPSNSGVPHELAAALEAMLERVRNEGAGNELSAEMANWCQRAELVLAQRHRLVDELGTLCQELTESLTDLAENDSWARGQCEAMRERIAEGLSSRGVRAVSELLRATREQQGQLRADRENARDSLKSLIHRMLSELDQLSSSTGNFHASVGRYADVIESADSLESLAGTVREMVEESRSVHSLVEQTQQRLSDEHRKATDLTQRVIELEREMKRLSDEVSTDQLTQIANRRGLLQAFEIEQARHVRAGDVLSVALLDIDNFKRLNDELGHSVGDEALKSLAALVSATLRPSDHVARYGGEEFVVLLPATPVDEGQQILTRLQRSLTGGLFMHESKQVFVTFSAGVTAYRADERIEDALERADQGLYEAKRTGKNRTCVV